MERKEWKWGWKECVDWTPLWRQKLECFVEAASFQENFDLGGKTGGEHDTTRHSLKEHEIQFSLDMFSVWISPSFQQNWHEFLKQK